MRYFFALNIAVLLSLTPCGVTAQQVTVGPPLTCQLFISGEFDGRGIVDLDRFLVSLKEKRKCSVIYVYLDSPGGDVVTAMKVGRMLRRAKVHTLGHDHSCASACVLAFLGGVQRFPSFIGLHRAYAGSPSNSTREAQAKRDELDRLITVYLKEMNIPLRILDEMNAVSPGSVRWLVIGTNDEELRQLQISGEDPVWADERDSRYAKELGISMREYYSRRQRAEALCINPSSGDKEEEDRYYDCLADVIKKGERKDP